MKVNTQNFPTEVLEASHGVPVLVHLQSPTHPACQAMNETLEGLEQAYAGRFQLVTMNVDESAELVRALGVQRVPHLVLFDEGQPTEGFSGMLPEAALRAFLDDRLPDPLVDQRRRGREALAEKRYGEAVDALGLVLAMQPGDASVRRDYVVALARAGRLEDAERAFAVLGTPPTTGPSASVRQLLDVLRAGEPEIGLASGSPEVRMVAADRLISQGRWEQAMERLLEIVATDRAHGDDLARRRLVATFDLCPDAGLVSKFRRRLSATLF